MTADDLIGSWQCYEGDGIHGWDDRLLVFRKDADQMVLEIWVPRKNKENEPELRLFGPYFVQCLSAPDKLILLLEDKFKDEWNVWPKEGNTFMLTHPRSTAGITFYRRAPMPQRSA
jgi:hypothetical protein